MRASSCPQPKGTGLPVCLQNKSISSILLVPVSVTSGFGLSGCFFHQVGHFLCHPLLTNRKNDTSEEEEEDFLS